VIPQLLEKDVENMQAMATQKHFTIDGRSEIPLNEILIDSDKQSQELAGQVQYLPKVRSDSVLENIKLSTY
jgi:hypothetical protein